MKVHRLLWTAALFLSVAGCSLAGDVTPPPALATAQADQVVGTPTPELDMSRSDTNEVDLGAAAPQSPPDPAAGEATYTEKCAPCHGPQGLGGGELAGGLEVPPPMLGSPEVAQSANLAEWYQVVTEGRMERFMPPFASLSDQERWDVAAYALSLSTSPEVLAQGEALYGEECAACHGGNGTGVSAEIDLSDPEFIASQSAADLFEVISAGQGEMPAFALSLGAEARWALTRYVQTLAYAPLASQDEVLAAEPEAEELALAAIQGQVINGTPGASVPPDLEVELHAFDGQDEVLAETVTVGEDGSYAFDELAVVSGRLYVAAAEYQGVLYGSEVAHIAEAGETLSLPLEIYETTERTEAVRVDRLHVLFDFSGGEALRVLELWVISNLGDQTIATSQGDGVLEISLPEGAGAPRFEDGALGDRYAPTENGFIDRAPLRPGEGVAQLVFDFDMQYGGRLDFSQPMNYPVQAAVLLVDEGGPRIRGDGVEDQGLMTVSDLQMHNYALGPLAAGQAMEFTLSGSTRPLIELGGENTGRNLVIALGALGLVVIGVGSWWLLSRSGAEEPVEKSEGAEWGGPAGAPLGAERGELLRSIADLDDRYEAGEVPEAEYQRRRAELKARALELMAADD